MAQTEAKDTASEAFSQLFPYYSRMLQGESLSGDEATKGLAEYGFIFNCLLLASTAYLLRQVDLPDPSPVSWSILDLTAEWARTFRETMDELGDDVSPEAKRLLIGVVLELPYALGLDLLLRHPGAEKLDVDLLDEIGPRLLRGHGVHEIYYEPHFLPLDLLPDREAFFDKLDSREKNYFFRPPQRAETFLDSVEFFVDFEDPRGRGEGIDTSSDWVMAVKEDSAVLEAICRENDVRMDELPDHIKAPLCSVRDFYNEKKEGWLRQVWVDVDGKGILTPLLELRKTLESPYPADQVLTA